MGGITRLFAWINQVDNLKKKKIHTPFKGHATIVSGVDCLVKSIKIKDENINMV